jgi:hypothetical protein
MTYENIKFNKNHCVVSNGYFYYIDESNNVLYQKASDGLTVFTYPIIDIVGNPIKCMEFDGRYFWTLQEGSTNQDIVIKKYYEDNYVVHLEEVLEFYNDPDHSYNASTFALEFYNTTSSGIIYKNNTTISITEYTDNVLPGTVVTLGPNHDGHYENVTVTGTLSDGRLGLDFFVQHTYPPDVPIYFTTNLWILNKYAFKTYGDGALYQIGLPKKEIKSVTVDADFAAITASCFYNSSVDSYIILAWENNLRFLNTASLVVDKTMVVDNIKSDRSTIIPILTLQIDGDTLYRLQQSATYFEDDDDFSSVNFQPSPIRPFVDSVSIDVLPKILPANGINVANVKAVVKDQYGAPIQVKPVSFIDTDTVGFITTYTVYTSIDGTALVYYKAGIVPNTVFLTVTATQYD